MVGALFWPVPRRDRKIYSDPSTPWLLAIARLRGDYGYRLAPNPRVRSQLQNRHHQEDLFHRGDGSLLQRKISAFSIHDR